MKWKVRTKVNSHNSFKWLFCFIVFQLNSLEKQKLERKFNEITKSGVHKCFLQLQYVQIFKNGKKKHDKSEFE